MNEIQENLIRKTSKIQQNTKKVRNDTTTNTNNQKTKKYLSKKKLKF